MPTARMAGHEGRTRHIKEPQARVKPPFYSRCGVERSESRGRPVTSVIRTTKLPGRCLLRCRDSAVRRQDHPSQCPAREPDIPVAQGSLSRDFPTGRVPACGESHSGCGRPSVRQVASSRLAGSTDQNASCCRNLAKRLLTLADEALSSQTATPSSRGGCRGRRRRRCRHR